MAKRDFSTHFSLDNMRKYSIYAQELAAEKGIHPPIAALVSSIMGKLCREGHAEEDFSCLAVSYTHLDVYKRQYHRGRMRCLS